MLNLIDNIYQETYENLHAGEVCLINSCVNDISITIIYDELNTTVRVYWVWMSIRLIKIYMYREFASFDRLQFREEIIEGCRHVKN